MGLASVRVWLHKREHLRVQKPSPLSQHVFNGSPNLVASTGDWTAPAPTATPRGTSLPSAALPLPVSCTIRTPGNAAGGLAAEGPETYSPPGGAARPNGEGAGRAGLHTLPAWAGIIGSSLMITSLGNSHGLRCQRLPRNEKKKGRRQGHQCELSTTVGGGQRTLEGLGEGVKRTRLLIICQPEDSIPF